MAEATDSTPTVVIAGGGIAGLEALLGLHELAGERVQTTLVSPDLDFTYRPWMVEEPFSQQPAAQHALSPIAEQLGARFVQGTLARVDPAGHDLELGDGSRLHYDAAVICVGARNVEPYQEALTFRTGQDLAGVDSLLSELAGRGGEEKRRVAFVIPPHGSWPLPVYELALLTRRRISDLGLGNLEVMLVTPEPSPLILFGTVASDAVGELLAGRGIELRTAARVHEEADGELVISPGGESLNADVVVAFPVSEGPRIPGLPDEDGFIPIDEHARVKGVEDVYAAGDGTNFPIKQGGLGTQQADAAAEHIATRFGSELEPHAFRPVLRGMLLTGDESLSMSHSLTGGEGEGLVSSDYLWWPPHKVSGRYLAPWLAGAKGYAELAPPGRPLEVEIALPAHWHSEPTDLDPHGPPPEG
jgi:sulfide:quinone oxidoreductase